MKTLKPLFSLSVALFLASTAAFALPAWKGGAAEPAMTTKDFAAVKAGDRIALVCKASNSVQVIDIKDKASALELCKSGRMLHCPICKKNFKVTSENPAGKGHGGPATIVAVNEKGEPCMFFAKLAN